MLQTEKSDNDRRWPTWREVGKKLLTQLGIMFAGGVLLVFAFIFMLMAASATSRIERGRDAAGIVIVQRTVVLNGAGTLKGNGKGKIHFNDTKKSEYFNGEFNFKVKKDGATLEIERGSVTITD